MDKGCHSLILDCCSAQASEEFLPFGPTHHHDDKWKSNQQVGHGQGIDGGRYHEGYTDCPDAGQSHGQREAKETQKGGLQT